MTQIEISPVEQRLKWAGYGLWWLLLLASVVFARLKMCFTDPAFHSFELLHKEDFAIQVQRFGAVATQWAALAGYWLRLPLWAALTMYSAVFMLLHLAAYHWLIRRQGVWAAWLLVLSYLLFSTDLFYWTISEHQQAIIYLIVWAAWAWAEREQWRAWHSLVDAGVVVWVVFLYPSSVFTLFFVAGFVALHLSPRLHWRAWLRWLAFGGLLAATTWLKTTYFANTYDAEKYKTLWAGWDLFWHQGQVLPSMRAFLRHCVWDYHWAVLAALLWTVFYAMERRFLLLFWSWANLLLLILLTQLTIHADVPKFYIDNIYLPLGFMVALPLCCDVARNMRWARLLAMGLIAFLPLRLAQLAWRGGLYAERQAWVAAVVEKMQAQEGFCFIAEEGEVPRERLLYTWAMPYETLLYSAWSDPTRARTLLLVPRIADYSALMQAGGENRYFGTLWGNVDTWKTASFRAYFTMPDMQYRRLEDLPK